MRVDFSVRRFPVTPELATKCGVPFSCVVQPFATPEDQGDLEEVASVNDVARCASCFSYVNCYSAFSPVGWTCSICGKANSFRTYARSRYQLPPKELALLPEVSCHAYEAAVGEPVPIAAGPNGFSGPAPVYVALVDLGAGAPGGGPEFVELVRSALEAALEALPPAALFGLITFSDKLALHDLRADAPTSRVVPLSGPHQLPVPLAEVMPLAALLAPVGAFKGRIADTLEGLMADPGCVSAPAPAAAPGSVEPMSRAADGTGGGGGAATQQQPLGPPRCRALGPALLAVLDYLRGLQQPPFVAAGARGSEGGTAGAQAIAELLPDASSPLHLMLFLSGPADLGPGRVVKPPKRATPASAGTVSVEGAAAVAQKLRELDLEEQAEQARAFLGGSAYARDTLSFYEGAAVAAASLGACVDVFAVSPGLVGLPTLEAVCNSTGGAMFLYPSADESALPQDVYRRLSGARASAGLLRVRTSHGFRPARFYGRLFPDRKYDNLHHVVACDASDTFVRALMATLVAALTNVHFNDHSDDH
ncbi:hypothetical protein FOA52_009578 [Chlamydomonas sp. UWO 241]|nr:hypothetical protein FOA52_009578 [Chlamydomonas sp. UWO 241]